MSTEFDELMEQSQPLTESLIERMRILREKAEHNKREEVLAKPSDMSVEEAFEKTFARYEGTFKELSER